MNAKTFLIAHGEKLIVAAIAGGCGLVLWGAIDDPSIRPKEDQQAIEAKNAKIDKVFKTQNPPVMKEPRPYLDQLLARISEAAPITPTMAWLTNPPDKGRVPDQLQPNPNGTKDPTKITPPQPPTGGVYLYVYELLAPEVGIEDAIGSLKISVAAPAAAGAAARPRVSGEAERKWERQDKGKIENTGRHLGLEVQIKIGENPWKPLVLPGATPEGLLPMSAIPTSAVTIPTPEPWQLHKLRARVIASATALDIDKPLVERPRYTVLVSAGQASAGPTEDTPLIDKALAQIRVQKGDLFKSLLRPAQGALPPGIKLSENEKRFEGPWSPVAEVGATASVRFALVGLTTAALPDNPAKTRDVGRFLLLRLFEQGGERKWMKKPLEEKFGVGDVLGKKDVDLVSPFDGKKIRQDLDTPFVVDKLIKDQERVLYWFVKPVARQGGGKRKDLLLDKKPVKTDIIELKNPETGNILVLTKLISVNPPTGKDVLFYPHRTASLNEREEFTKAPSEFKQYGLVPDEPKKFKPGTGPLTELYKAKADEGALDVASYETDTDYYVFPDGRIAWWELVENGLKVHDPEGVMTPKAAAPGATAPTPTPEAPEAPPAATPPKGKPPAGGRTPAPGMTPDGLPGMPPGMAPPDMPQPGMPPIPPR